MIRRFETLRRSWFGPFHPWRVRRRGRADGNLQPPVPPWEAVDQPPHVMEIKRAGDGDLQLINLAWDDEDRELKGRYGKLQKHCDQTEARKKQAEKDFEAAAKRYEELHKKPVPTRSDRSHFLYAAIACLISGFEIPLNITFFRLFGESEVLTAVATIGLAFVLMFCAHFLGQMLKDGPKGSRVRTALIACMIVMPLALIAGIAFLRVAYIQQQAETARGLNPIVLLVVSAALNSLMFTVAMVAAYAFHEEGRKAVDRTRRDFAAATKERQLAERALAGIEEHRRKVFDGYKTRAQHTKDVAEGLIETYRTANLAARQDRDQHAGMHYPASYLPEVVIKIPMPLRNADPPALGKPHSAVKAQTGVGE